MACHGSKISRVYADRYISRICHLAAKFRAFILSDVDHLKSSQLASLEARLTSLRCSLTTPGMNGASLAPSKPHEDALVRLVSGERSEPAISRVWRA